MVPLSATAGSQGPWIIFAAIVGAVLLGALAMALHSWTPRGDRPRMTVREFLRGVRW